MPAFLINTKKSEENSMIIVMKRTATQNDIENVEKVLREHGLGIHLSTGADATIIGVIGDQVGPLRHLHRIDGRRGKLCAYHAQL